MMPLRHSDRGSGRLLWVILLVILLLFVAASRLRNRPVQPAAPVQSASPRTSLDRPATKIVPALNDMRAGSCISL